MVWSGPMDKYYLHNTLSYTNSINRQSLCGSSFEAESYDVNYDQILRQTCEEQRRLKVSSSREILLPLSILEHNSSLEAIVLYLKDILGLRFSQISSLLDRNQRTVWVTYASAKKKNFMINTTNNSQIFIPLDILSSRNLSVLESIVVYLRITYNLSFNQVSDLLGKNYRTIWTVYRRALKKLSVKIKHEQ